MKLLYLMFKTHSKGFAREIFLMLQIFVSVSILNAALLPFINYFEQSSIIKKGMDNAFAYYSVPYGDAGGEDYVGKFLTDPKISDVGLTYYTLGKVNGIPADIYLYNEGMFDQLELALEEGSWVYGEHVIYMNSDLYDLCGTSESGVSVSLMEDIPIPESRTVGGIINRKNVVFDCGIAGGKPGLEVLSKDFSDLRNINSSRTRYLAIIPFDLSASSELRAKLSGAILHFGSADEAAAYAAEYNAADENGRITLLPELYANSEDRLTKTYNLQIVIGGLMALSSLFGIGGYTYLKIEAMRSQAGVYAICGCTKGKYSRIILFSQIPIIVVPVAAAFGLRNVLTMTEGENTLYSLLIAVGFACAVFILPIIVTLHIGKSRPFYTLIQEEE